MKTVDEIIRLARVKTKTDGQVYDAATGVTTSGISQDIFTAAINDAQDHLQSAIVNANSNLFIAQETQNLVGETQEYSLTKRIFAGTKLVSVQLNLSSNTTDFGDPLKKAEPRDLIYWKGTPYKYMNKGGVIVLCPIPSSSTGQIKVTFYEELNDLDIKRGKVSGTPSTTNITLAASSPTPDDYGVAAADYICISDVDGNVRLLNGQMVSYNSTTHVITLAANVSTYLTGSYALADLANQFVTIGKHTTIVSSLPNTCERYLRVFCEKAAKENRESSSTLFTDKDMMQIEEDIISLYEDEDRDIEEFPVLDTEVLY